MAESLAREFERVRLADSIQRCDDLNELKKVAQALLECNFKLKEQLEIWMEKGLWG